MHRKFHRESFKDKTVLVTGGGSLGTELVGLLLECNVHAVRVLDNSEHSLFQLEQKFRNKRIRFLLGDVVDYDRVEFAMNGADYVIHTAANKFVNYIEYNPPQAIHTNIDGTINVIKAAVKTPSVKKTVYISSDKACNATSIYGLTKAIGERLITWASRVSDKVFATIRFPNFMPSRGSCFNVWEEQSATGKPITITDERMTRYFIPLKEAAELTLKTLEIAEGGEIYVPATAKEHKIIDLARKYGKNFVIIGRRLGERLHEKLMTEEEKEKAVLEGNLWKIKQ